MEHDVILHQRGEALEIVQMGDKEMRLILSSPCGTEVIHHSIPKGAQWYLVPEEGWEATESVYVLTGKLLFKRSSQEILLTKGDSVSFRPVDEYCLFEAIETSEFLYTTTEPVFHSYSVRTKELAEMSVSIELKDGYTSDHCSRIRDYSIKVGKKLGLSNSDLYILAFGAFFHDLGKIMIPENILLKPGKLTPKEYEAIKLHTVYGGSILRETRLAHLIKAAEIVEQHHERYNGSGYPIGYAGDEINMGAKIVAVVDSYDAMTTDRIYQKARSKEEAIEEIRRCRGTYFAPEVVDAFISFILEESEGR